MNLIVIKGFTKFKWMERGQLKKEQKLFCSFQAGEERGFDYFFSEHFKSLAYFAHKLLRDEALAEDVVQDSFVKLWQHREVMDAPGSIKSYLYTTVKNGCIDLRSEKRKQRGEKDLLTLSSQFETSVLHAIIETEVLRLLLAAKETLPPRGRQVFELFYLHNKSYQEIAHEMGISIHTVKNQKMRAVKALRKQFPYITVLLYLLEQNRS